MRLVILLTLLGLFGIVGCGPSKPKIPQKPEPEPIVPTIEPPMPEPMEKTPVTPEKKPEGTTPEKKPEETPPEKKPEGTTTTSPLPADVAGLIESLKKADSRDGAVAGLKSKGKDVVPDLISALEKDSGEARHGLLLTLGAFGKEAAAALPELKKIAAAEKDPATRDTAQFTIDAIEGN